MVFIFCPLNCSSLNSQYIFKVIGTNQTQFHGRTQGQKASCYHCFISELEPHLFLGSGGAHADSQPVHHSVPSSWAGFRHKLVWNNGQSNEGQLQASPLRLCPSTVLVFKNPKMQISLAILGQFSRSKQWPPSFWAWICPQKHSRHLLRWFQNSSQLEQPACVPCDNCRVNCLSHFAASFYMQVKEGSPLTSCNSMEKWLRYSHSGLWHRGVALRVHHRVHQNRGGTQTSAGLELRSHISFHTFLWLVSALKKCTNCF